MSVLVRPTTRPTAPPAEVPMHDPQEVTENALRMQKEAAARKRKENAEKKALAEANKRPVKGTVVEVPGANKKGGKPPKRKATTALDTDSD